MELTGSIGDDLARRVEESSSSRPSSAVNDITWSSFLSAVNFFPGGNQVDLSRRSGSTYTSNPM